MVACSLEKCFYAGASIILERTYCILKIHILSVPPPSLRPGGLHLHRYLPALGLPTFDNLLALRPRMFCHLFIPGCLHHHPHPLPRDCEPSVIVSPLTSMSLHSSITLTSLSIPLIATFIILQQTTICIFILFLWGQWQNFGPQSRKQPMRWYYRDALVLRRTVNP
jgi:hypothetical protein